MYLDRVANSSLLINIQVCRKYYQMSFFNIELLILFSIILVIALYALSSQLLEHFKIKFLHESGVGIIIGWFIGLIVYFTYNSELQDFNFNDNIFFYGLLPPIIFAGGYNLKKKKFFQHFFYVFLYGILGTFICFLVTLVFTKLINQANLIVKFTRDGPRQIIQLSARNILLFAATICASDSVAALTLIGQKHPKIFSIIFGESLINDAVAIILYRSVDTLNHGQFSLLQSFELIGNFLYILILSLTFGVIFGLACCLIFKRFRFLVKNPVAEAAMTFLFGILAYFASQLFHFSGVISVLVAGIIMSHYNFYNLSNTGQIATTVSLQSVSFICEAFIFVYLGLNFWTLFTDSNGNEYWWSLSFVFFQILLCGLGRIISIYALSGIAYLCRKKQWKVNIYELNIIWFSGIIRGSVAFALILTMTASTPEEMHQVQIIKSSVLFMVFFTTIICGGVMNLFIEFNLSRVPSIPQIQSRIVEKNEENSNMVPESENRIYKYWHFLDQKYFKSWFIYNYVERESSIRKFKQQVKKHMELHQEPFTAIFAASVKMNNMIAQDPAQLKQMEMADQFAQ